MDVDAKVRKTVQWSRDVNKIAPDFCGIKPNDHSEHQNIKQVDILDQDEELGIERCDDAFLVETRPFTFRKYNLYLTKVTRISFSVKI